MGVDLSVVSVGVLDHFNIRTRKLAETVRFYEDVLGPKYGAIRAWWANKSQETHRPLEEAVSEEGFRDEFIGGVSAEIAQRVEAWVSDASE